MPVCIPCRVHPEKKGDLVTVGGNFERVGVSRPNAGTVPADPHLSRRCGRAFTLSGGFKTMIFLATCILSGEPGALVAVAQSPYEKRMIQ